MIISQGIDNTRVAFVDKALEIIFNNLYQLKKAFRHMYVSYEWASMSYYHDYISFFLDFLIFIHAIYSNSGILSVGLLLV